MGLFPSYYILNAVELGHWCEGVTDDKGLSICPVPCEDHVGLMAGRHADYPTCLPHCGLIIIHFANGSRSWIFRPQICIGGSLSWQTKCLTDKHRLIKQSSDETPKERYDLRMFRELVTILFHADYDKLKYHANVQSLIGVKNFAGTRKTWVYSTDKELTYHFFISTAPTAK